MASSRDIIKPRWRPAAGRGTGILVRLQPAQLAALDVFIAKQPKEVSRPAAIRALVAEVLTNGGPTNAELLTALRTLTERARESCDEFVDGDHCQSEELHGAIV